ncbi:DUF2058 domain-containing protein [Lysobacter sp. A3-1-A15]|uniref:DUF2058 domain-containing protein n=1 Tax=Novilysobacter viscosus TaxID=3098602 RepID=UPI002ED7B759
MTDTLRNQLLGLGFKPAPKPERPADKANRGGKPRRDRAANPRKSAPPGTPTGGPAKPRSREDIDLAKAYAIRAQREKDERVRAEQARQEAARQRREGRARVESMVKDGVLNVADADIARHFQYGGKIKRVYVTADQLKALNAGELGVLQLNGHYKVVTAGLLAQAEAIFPECVALKVDPDAPAGDDPYADPRYQVPDDLVW